MLNDKSIISIILCSGQKDGFFVLYKPKNKGKVDQKGRATSGKIYISYQGNQNTTSQTAEVLKLREVFTGSRYSNCIHQKEPLESHLIAILGSTSRGLLFIRQGLSTNTTYMLTDYRYILWDYRTGQKEVLPEAMSRQYSYKLNRAGGASFTLPITIERLKRFTLYLGNTRLLIYRNGKLIWQGVIAEIAESGQDDEGTVSVQCVEIFHILQEKRFVSNVYTNTDAGAIAMDLITITQNQTGGNLGIIQGTIEPTVSRDRVYLDEKVGEKIVQLTEVINGFDFTITPTIKDNSLSEFNVYQRRGQELQDIRFEYGEGLKSNIQAWSRQRVLADIFNSIQVEGEGLGDSRLIASQSNFSLINAVGLLEGRVQEKSVNQLDTLDEKANEVIRVQSIEQPIYNLTLNNAFDDFGKYDVGDIVGVKIQQGYVDINTTMRIYGIEVRVSDTGEEVIKLTVSTIA